MDGVQYTTGDLSDHEGIAAVIRDEQERILMQDHVKYGFWTIPVGKAEPGQTPRDALVKEVEEECGIRVLEARQVAERKYEYTRNGRAVRMVLHAFSVDRWSGIPRNNEPHKHRTLAFLTVDEILRLPYLSDATLLFLGTLGRARPARLGA